MDFFDLVNISEKYQELINPSSTEKILKVGKILGLKEGSTVIEFGCGFAEILAQWGDAYGISGVGIDIRPHACERAQKKMDDRGYTDRFEIVCGKGAEYKFEPHSYDAAICIGASFVFGDYRKTIQAMKEAIKPGGKLAIGEPYWRTSLAPPEFVKSEGWCHTEHDLLKMTREEGFDVEYIIRASHDDWDRYESDNWYGLNRWIEENPDHPEFQEVVDHLHKGQDEYFRYGREYLGWAMYVLNPMGY